MKIFKYLLIIIGLLFCSSDLFSAKTGWYKVTVPTDSTINDISFYNSDFGVITSLKNELFLTFDGGNTFINKSTTIKNLINKNLFLIKITKPNEIYLTTDKQIYLSNDTCKTWILLNSISLSNDTINCTNFYKLNDNCYCSDDRYRYFLYKDLDTTKIYYSNDNMKTWRKLYGLKNDDRKSLYHTTYFLDSINIAIVSRMYYYENGITIKRNNLDYYTNNIQQNISKLYDKSLLNNNYFSDINSIVKVNSNLYITFQSRGMFKSFDNGTNWEKFSNFESGGVVYSIKNEIFYGVGFSSIYKFNKNIIANCKIDVNSNFNIDKIEVIDDKIAFALLDRTFYTGQNYFLKTEDGGGVDLSDVEEVIPQDDLTQSTHIELYDILGRSIATFTSYEKLKAEIENYPPPHLIKWRDEKGIFHFEKMK